MSVTSWFLVSSGGTRHRLPREMIFVGRDDCELMLQSRSVDKQHAVINYEAGTDEHKVKDLGSLNGTFVNDVRIQEQMYITLKLEDKLRFGYDTNLFTVVRGELTVPEEALKHEKFTSGLQLSKKPSSGESTTTTTTSKSPTKTPTKTLKLASGSTQRPVESRATDGVTSSKEPTAKPLDAHKAEERLGGDVTALPRGTPLYGQPSWWGDGDADDENSFKQETGKSSNKKHDSSISDSKEARRGEKAKEDGLHASAAHDSSYFEIPTKEGHMANNGIHEIPTKDTEGTTTHTSTTTAQGHASFTIEFDNTSPGKVTIKDHVSKFTPDHHRSRSKKSGAGSGGAGGRDLSTLQAAMMASESKVADWLAQNDPTLVRSESTEDDSKSNKSIKSDVPVHLKRLKGSKHEDGTQSDSENGVGLRFANRRHALEERLKAAHGHVGGGTGGGSITVSGTRATSSRTAFMIEFYDEENPRKRRSYSFSQTAPLQVGGAGGEGLFPQPPSHPKVFSISTSATTASDAGKVPAPISATVAAGAPTAARVLLKQRSEDPSIGRSSASTGLATGSPTSPSEDASVVGRGAGTAGGQAEDDHSDKGTYTIELENRNAEEEEARRMIDKVFGVQQNQDSSSLSDLKGEGKGKDTGETGKEAIPGDPSWVSQWASLAANHTRTDPEGSGAETAAFLHKERTDAFESGASLSRGESSSSLTDRKRRTLPQLPVDDPRAKSCTKGLGLRSEIGEKQDTEPQEKENKGDGESPTPMGDSEMTSKRKQSSTSSPSKALLRTSGSSERRKKSEERKGGGGGGGGGGGEEGGEKSGKPLVRQGSFTIEKPSANVPAELIPRINRGGSGRERSDSGGSMDTATLLKDTEAVMAFLEAKLRDENKLEQKSSKTGIITHGSGSGFPTRTDSISPESDVDTASTASHVAGEAERKASAGGEQKRRSFSSMHREKSNMSTASKTSVTNASARERLERKSKTRTVETASRTDARRSVQPSSATSRARQPSLDLTDDDQTSSFPISDILSSDQETYSGPLGHSKLDSRSAKSSTCGSSKTSRTLQAATTSSLNKQASLPQPRPTRASLLRRARLGDTSDTDLADADRVSVASEVSTTSSTSKPPSGRKGLSRLDMLAQPRRNRLGSISARSDSECTVTRSSTSSPRLSAETALRLGLRSSTPTENRLTPRMRANSVSKLNETKTKTTTSGYCSPTVSSSSRWRRLPPEYGSTSEEEFGSNRNSPKQGGRSHIRPHHLVPHRGSRLSTTASPGSAVVTGPGGVGVKHRMKEQEEYIRDWTAHSEEIARLFPCVRRISQDLAKDLAILAREIHDVAGEIDSVSSSGTAPSTTVSTAATTPGSAIDTREEVGPARPTQPDIQESMRKLVDRVFDESLNFRKIPPVISTNKAPEINGKPVELRPRAPDSLEPRALRRRTWNREEAVLDSLLLNSVSQLSSKIRHSVDKTAGKIRILFKDKERNWDEIENKLRSESDIPLLKTSNKEISSILLELKRVEKQLQVINVMVDPDGTLDALASLGLTSPTTPTKPQTAKTTSPSATSPGSVLPAKESLPGILPVPGGSTARVQAACASTEETARQPSVGLELTGVGGLPFSRVRPSGEEAIAQK
ncbi:centrosomal protein of 170 kDa isoform X1 [Micropterus dolomieu]|uniref:centrosomal protein of 170 kDa isoform X1 n=1 Tax=Micropterus dolomieu TaxID=147949 RepID=UPI001E8D9BBC|nr:centrosomal protein of 170 kDa isoform X1 [Micropterus dolomieu]XP_045926043.1 centrosomal protein of 170 kDa isoform X1 [Micropterus dolomieu]XP_045926044.1 centrosomal protein of 170 kDa isoform X1 [Micropterus dolomieu]